MIDIHPPFFTIEDHDDGTESVILLMMLDEVEHEIGQYSTIDEAVIALKAAKTVVGVFMWSRFKDHAAQSQGVGVAPYGSGPNAKGMGPLGPYEGSPNAQEMGPLAPFQDGGNNDDTHPIIDTHHLGHPANQGPCVPRDPAAFPLKQPQEHSHVLTGKWCSTTSVRGVQSGNDGQPYTEGERACFERYLKAEGEFTPYLWVVQCRHPAAYAQYIAGDMTMDALKAHVGPLTAPSSFIGEASLVDDQQRALTALMEDQQRALTEELTTDEIIVLAEKYPIQYAEYLRGHMTRESLCYLCNRWVAKHPLDPVATNP